MKPTCLRCEYLSDPLGIDQTQPRLFWTLGLDGEADSGGVPRGKRQTAYRILVDATREDLAADKGGLWDSGRIESERTTHIVYQGAPLTSGRECWWKVKVWDERGEASDWSESARWSMGLLDSNDWRAQWIGHDRPLPTPLNFEGCSWIEFPYGDNAARPAPSSDERRDICFRKQVSIPEDRTLDRVWLLLFVDGHSKLYVNGTIRDRCMQNGLERKQPNVLNLTKFFDPGINTVGLRVHDVAAVDAAAAGKLVFEFADAEPATELLDASWKVHDEDLADWIAADFNDGAWVAARERADKEDSPWDKVNEAASEPMRLPLLRREFALNKPVRRAWVHASALGIYDLYLNGDKVGRDYFSPGWTDYTKRIHYRTYDVTGVLREGANCIGAALGPGWYAGNLAWKYNQYYGSRTWFRGQLHVEYDDGTSEVIGTDRSWKASEGPYIEGDFLMGEQYDARKELPGWCERGFGGGDWESADVLAEPSGAPLVAHPSQPVRETEELAPIAHTEPRPGVHVFDLGQNIIGIVRLKVNGPAGTRVILRHAEALKEDGSIYTVNLRRARATDVYVLKGDGEETWQPRFTFHGFRYIEVTGYSGGAPPLDAVTGVVLHSDFPRGARFECSNPTINRLMKNIQWSQRGNFLEVPTDCPQRDERLGWTGDAQVFIRTATYLGDVSAFFTKWLRDVADAQAEDGACRDVVPHLDGLQTGDAAWADAAIVCPEMIHRSYGDRLIIERMWPCMTRYMEWMKGRSPGLIRPDARYGDWLSIQADTPKDLIATAYFAYQADLLSEMGRAIGLQEEAAEYGDLAREIKEAFNREFVDDSGRLTGDTQTAYVLALYMNLLPEQRREQAMKYLIEDIRNRGWRLSVGFVGIRHLCPVLSRFGRLDVAYHLLNSEEYPSWGFEVRNGATTIWERWDSWTPERGFQTPGMNSFNHYAFGSIGEWIFDTMIGIDTLAPGFQEILVRPRPGGGLTYAKASVTTIRGPVRCEWKLVNGQLCMEVELPPNTTAMIHVPATNAENVMEGGGPAGEAPGLKFVEFAGGAAVYQAGSGVYRFVSTEPTVEAPLRIAETPPAAS